MIRRIFMAGMIGFIAIPITDASERILVNRRFAFKIKTKEGSIVSNVLIEAHDEDAAKAKLFKRYPGCQVLRVDEK